MLTLGIIQTSLTSTLAQPHLSSLLTPNSSLLTPNSSLLIPNSSFGITLNITHFHPILFHITHGAPLGLALNLSCHSPFARSQSLRYLTHTGVGVSPIQVSVSHPYTQRGLTHRTLSFYSFHMVCSKGGKEKNRIKA